MRHQARSSSDCQHHVEHGDDYGLHEVSQDHMQGEALEDLPEILRGCERPPSPDPLNQTVGSQISPEVPPIMIGQSGLLSTPPAYPPYPPTLSPSDGLPAILAGAYSGIRSRHSRSVAPPDTLRSPAEGRGQTDGTLNRHLAVHVNAQRLVLQRKKRLVEAWMNGENVMPPRHFSDSEMQALANSLGHFGLLLRLEEKFRRAMVARQARDGAAARGQSQSLQAEEDLLPDFAHLSLDSLPDLANLSLE